MLAAWYDRPGPAAEVLRVGETADPSPAPGDVRVRVNVSGITPGDTKKRGGRQLPRLPAGVPGAGSLRALRRLDDLHRQVRVDPRDAGDRAQAGTDERLERVE